jgi:hypothetical protein
MNSQKNDYSDFLPNAGIFSLSEFNNDFFPQNQQNKISKDREAIQNEFEPNFFLHIQTKEDEEADMILENNANLNKVNRKNYLNSPSFFLQNYDEDSENNDNEKLIINTTSDLENLDDSNHFANLNFDNQEVLLN